MSAEKDDWLFLYLFQCSDYLVARASFVNLLFPLLSMSIPEGVEDLSFGEHGDGNGKIVDKVVIIIQEFISTSYYYYYYCSPTPTTPPLLAPRSSPPTAIAIAHHA